MVIAVDTVDARPASMHYMYMFYKQGKSPWKTDVLLSIQNYDILSTDLGLNNE